MDELDFRYYNVVFSCILVEPSSEEKSALFKRSRIWLQEVNRSHLCVPHPCKTMLFLNDPRPRWKTNSPNKRLRVNLENCPVWKSNRSIFLLLTNISCHVYAYVLKNYYYPLHTLAKQASTLNLSMNQTFCKYFWSIFPSLKASYTLDQCRSNHNDCVTSGRDLASVSVINASTVLNSASLAWSQGEAPVLALQRVGFSTVLPQTERTPFRVLSFPC